MLESPRLGTPPPWRRLCILLSVIAGLLAIVAVELALLLGPSLPSAQAQIPDSGAQRREMIDELRQIERRLEEVGRVLRTEVLKVRVIGTDTDKKPADPPARRAREGP